jgi:uncharacterized protein YlxW (UPF0749 family)
MTQLEPFQLILILLTIFSSLWAIRAHFKNYQKEDSMRATETALTMERISSLNSKFDTLTQRISEVEKSHTEMHIIRAKVNTVYDDMKAVNSKIDSIIKILLEKVH